MVQGSCHYQGCRVWYKDGIIPSGEMVHGHQDPLVPGQGRLAYIRYRPLAVCNLPPSPDLALWHTSQERTILLTSALSPTQYQVNCSRAMVLPTPEWDTWWVCHIKVCRFCSGHMATHLGFSFIATWISRTPCLLNRIEVSRWHNFLSS